MTYRELLNALQNFSPEQLDMTVTVHESNDEWHAATLNFSSEENDVLDENHPFLEIE